MFSFHRKVCIVGGGPAGSAAIALKRIGCAVTVIDCALPPINKPCGEGLMPDSVSELRALGIDIPDHVGFPFRGIRFADSRSSVCAEFPNGVAKGIRRTVLHDLLIQHATSAGVSVIWNAKHVQLSKVGYRLVVDSWTRTSLSGPMGKLHG